MVRDTAFEGLRSVHDSRKAGHARPPPNASRGDRGRSCAPGRRTSKLHDAVDSFECVVDDHGIFALIHDFRESDGNDRRDNSIEDEVVKKSAVTPFLVKKRPAAIRKAKTLLIAVV